MQSVYQLFFLLQKSLYFKSEESVKYLDLYYGLCQITSPDWQLQSQRLNSEF